MTTYEVILMTTAELEFNYPRLRPLDIRHHVQDGQPYILLRDPLELSEGMLLIPQPLAAALAFVDGRHDAAGIAQAFTQHYRMLLDRETVEELLAALDQALLLENERSAAAIQRVLDEYRQAPYRQPIIAGRGYPAEPAALHQFLNDYLEAADVTPRPLAEWPARMGILSPHIDYARGGPVYAQVWKHVAEAVKAADLVVMLGTDHYGDDPITLTRQNYATPYGVLPTDQAMVDKLAAAVGEEAAFAGELRHRDEHSLELVAVWLHHMRDGEPVPVVPILTGSFYRFMVNGEGPESDPMLERLLETLREASAGKRVVVVASGDLAHVGPAFGGAPLDMTTRERVRRADDELIERMQAGDSDGFYQAIRRVENGNNVCGVSPIYLTMRLVEGDRQPLTGQPFGYATCPADDNDTSAVTVCGMAFS
jgi:AmmeMemoRadiSam system protein B